MVLLIRLEGKLLKSMTLICYSLPRTIFPNSCVTKILGCFYHLNRFCFENSFIFHPVTTDQLKIELKYLLAYFKTERGWER